MTKKKLDILRSILWGLLSDYKVEKYPEDETLIEEVLKRVTNTLK